MIIPLIRFICPHCNSEGQVLLQSALGILILSCSECQQPIVIFMGYCLALDPDFFSWDAKKQTIALKQLVIAATEKTINNHFAATNNQPIRQQSTGQTDQKGPITAEEKIFFTENELGLLGDDDKFRRIFGRGGHTKDQ
jgi:hypothetical protein